MNNRADEIEKAMIEGFEDDATDVLEAFIEYLQEIKKGEHEEEAENLYSIIDGAFNCRFNKRHLPVVRFINGSIRWKAEQIAAEEEKLTTPTRD